MAADSPVLIELNSDLEALEHLNEPINDEHPLGTIHKLRLHYFEDFLTPLTRPFIDKFIHKLMKYFDISLTPPHPPLDCQRRL